MSLIDPNLLQLIGLGSQGDHDLADGRHLRWMFHRLLGFPRTGFLLMRRPSLLTSDFNPQQPGMPVVHSVLTRRAELGTGNRFRYTQGLTVSKADGFDFGPPESGGQPLLRIGGKPVVLEFGQEGTPPSGDLSNPAAYVLLTILRRSRTGSVVARGYYDMRPKLRLVDEAAVGGDLRVDLSGLLSDVRRLGATRRVLSSGERLMGEGAIVRRDAVTEAVIAQRGLRPLTPRPATDPNPFVTQTLLLHGGLLERIELVGRDSNLLEVKWVTTQNLIKVENWKQVDHFFLPFTHHPELYPDWSTESGADVARKRLLTSPPKRQPPWDREDGGTPPLLRDTVSASVLDSLKARYLGNEFKQVEIAIGEFLRGELTQVIPQSLVTVTERLEPEPGDESGPEPMDVTVSPFDLLYGASADPAVARELGLATVDTEDPGGIYDYVVHAGFPLMWWFWVVNNRQGREMADRLRSQLGGGMVNWNARPFTSNMFMASVVTGLKQMPTPALEPPPGLHAEVIPDAVRSPVQARVRLHWPRSGSNLFENPHQTRVLHVFKRVSDAGDVLLHHRDDETKLLAPHLPTPYGETEPQLNLIDREVPSYGEHTWKVAAMDLFGRLSDDAVASADVQDTIAPPPPGKVEAVLEGDATTGLWTRLVVSFDWLPSSERVAPDLRFFELHVRQGALSNAEAPLPATWGKFETTPGATAGPVRVTWPSLQLSHVPAGLTIHVSAVNLSEGGSRITVDVSPVASPFDDIGYARIAVAVRAFDQWGNASGFAVARAERVDLSVPPPPSFAADPELATRPDAQNRSWFRVPIPSVAGASVRVLRAASVALLAESNTSPAEFAALSEPEQVGLLRTLAVDHREPFATDHEEPVPANGQPYLMEFGGSNRGLTIVTLVMISRTGAQSTWPSDAGTFMVIKVPRNEPPPTPLIRDTTVGNQSVALSIAPDVTGLASSLAVYRARSEADAGDVRRMRPVQEIAVALPPDPTVVIDSGLFEEVTYFYRIVAIGSDGLRSAPTASIPVVLVAPGPPPPPVVSAVERVAADPGRRRVRLVVPRRDYAVYLFRRRQFALDWETPTASGMSADGKLNFTSLTATPHPDGYEIVIEDFVPPSDDAYSYFARIEDPRGRITAGAPRMETI